MSEKVDLAEKQIQRWRYRLPDLTDDEDHQSVVSAVEVQEHLNEFQESTRNKVHSVRQETDSFEGRLRLLEVARSEFWELISQRLSSMVGHSVGSSSDHLTDGH